jgi:hypothetical protein
MVRVGCGGRYATGSLVGDTAVGPMASSRHSAFKKDGFAALSAGQLPALTAISARAAGQMLRCRLL